LRDRVCSPTRLFSLFDTAPRLCAQFFAKVAGTVDRYEGHFSDCQARACDEDRAAIEWARQLVTDYAIELWCGARFSARLEPRPAQ
jgi:hypothetical protein